MASKTETYYPPYMGEEPYIHLCFSDKDERKVQPLLRRLLLRGCRVWYCLGEVRDRNSQNARDERMLKAGLTVLFLTDAARQDTQLKTRLLVCQTNRQPILILNTDGKDSGLSTGITKAAVVHVLGGSAGDAVDAILHGQGFSQLFLGDPQPVYDHLLLRRISAALVLLSLLLMAGGGIYIYLHPPEPAPKPLPQDTVTIEDEALRSAVRSTIGGGAITEEALLEIRVLSLAQLPENEEELALLPSLTALILSQEAAQAAPEHPSLYDSYTLIVAGGDRP